MVLFLMIRRPPRSTRTDTLFPTRRSSDLYYIDAVRQMQAVGNSLAQALDRALADAPAVVRSYIAPVARRLELGAPVDRKSTRLTPVTNAHLVCRLLLEKKKTINILSTRSTNIISTNNNSYSNTDTY